MLWVHKKCSGIKRPIPPDPNVLDVWAQQIDVRPMEVVRIGEDRLEVIPEFCYLGGGMAVGSRP